MRPAVVPLLSKRRASWALYALTIGAFGIGTTEFVIMGLLQQVAADLEVTIASAGLLISGYALGVFIGAPLLTAACGRLSRKHVLVGLMAIFTLGNMACALAPTYELLMLARIVTSLAHGTFFGVGSVVATSLVPQERRAGAIAILFTGLTVATLLGVPAGAWLGLTYGWRATFWAVTVIGLLAILVIGTLVPRNTDRQAPESFRAGLAAIRRPAVLLGLLTTVLGFAGVFTVFTYIQPLLTDIGGFSEGAVSPILLMFGTGMIAGNLLGGRLADRSPGRALWLSLLCLAGVLALTAFALRSQVTAVVFVGLLGITAFATVPPLQLWVLNRTEGASSLASSFNIGAFNLGNAIGAWLGGTVIRHGAGLGTVPWVASLVTLTGLLVAAYALSRERSEGGRPVDGCPLH